MRKHSVGRALSRIRRLALGLDVEWRELGGLGRIAFLGTLASGILAVTLGLSIPNAAREDLLDARADVLTEVSENLASRNLIPIGTADPSVYSAFDEAVRLQLLGGETVRVKLWSPEGEIVYSDEERLIGRRFGLFGDAKAALRGKRAVKTANLAKPENVYEQGLGQLLEFYLPVRNRAGKVIGLFEVYQQADSLNRTVNTMRRNVWLSIGTGLAVLGVFIGALTLANARVLSRRRRQVEGLLGALLHAQHEERKRIVGALHDDIGQPLYRLLYGLQGCRAKVGAGHPVSGELAELEDLVRGVDRTLRTELKVLRHGLAEDLGLKPALVELVETTRAETGLQVELEADVEDELDPVLRSALYRAAQEGLMNVRKHARATAVSVRVRADGARAVLEVRDDGNGVRGPAGLGLVTTREQLEAVGGGLTVESHRGQGTVFSAWVPVGHRGADE